MRTLSIIPSAVARPCDGLTVAVPVLDERLDRLVENLHGAERATPDQLPGNDAVPDLDLVHPRRARGGSEVENDSSPLRGEPFLGFLRQVHGSIVEDDVDFLVGVAGDDLLHQPQKIRRRVRVGL